MRLPCLLRKVSDETTAFASEHVIHHSEPHLVCTIREPPTLKNVHYTNHETTLLGILFSFHHLHTVFTLSE